MTRGASGVFLSPNNFGRYVHTLPYFGSFFRSVAALDFSYFLTVVILTPKIAQLTVKMEYMVVLEGNSLPQN